MYKILTATLAASAMAAGVAQAATTITTSFQVTATVQSFCSVTAPATLAFGAYTPGGGAQTANTVIAVKCTNTTPFTVALNKGSSGGTIAQRLMISGTNTLQYNLFTTSGGATIFGDGVTGVTVGGVGTGVATAVNVTAFGSLPDNATNQAAATGSYSDTVTVSVTY